MPANDPSDLDSDERQEVIDSICHYLALEHSPLHDSITPRDLADRVEYPRDVCEWALDELAKRESRVRWRIEEPNGPEYRLRNERQRVV